MSMFKETYLHLVNCSNDYINFVKTYLEGSMVHIFKYSSLGEFKKRIQELNPENDIFIIPNWFAYNKFGLLHFPSTFISKFIIFIRKQGFKVVLIEDHPLFYDKFQSSKLKNRLLTSKPVYKLLSIPLKKEYRHVDLIFANSNQTKNFIYQKFHLESTISFVPIHSKYFYYEYMGIRDKIVVHYSQNFDINIIKTIQSMKLNYKFILLNFPDFLQGKEFLDMDAEIKFMNNYSFNDIHKIYSRAAVTIISERKGAFEGMPTESIASGVPVISYDLPSIILMKSYLKEMKMNLDPFINIEEFTINSFKSMIDYFTEEKRKEIANIIGNYFSEHTIQQKFIKCFQEKLSLDKDF